MYMKLPLLMLSSNQESITDLMGFLHNIDSKKTQRSTSTMSPQKEDVDISIPAKHSIRSSEGSKPPRPQSPRPRPSPPGQRRRPDEMPLRESTSSYDDRLGFSTVTRLPFLFVTKNLKKLGYLIR
jgi:hypothetical protein